MSLRQLFADHYWDSFETDKETVLKHIDAVLDLHAAQHNITDIVERLRAEVDADVNEPLDRLLESAADEIERLRAAREAVVKECVTKALEQRCERGTPWDLACVTIAEQIMSLVIPSTHPSPIEKIEGSQ